MGEDNAVDDIPVGYYGQHNLIRGLLRIDQRGVEMVFGRKRSGGYSWDQVRRLSFDDPGTTKPDGNILLVGMWGVGNQKAFTLITVSVADADLFFENESPVASWRAGGLRILEEAPSARGKIFVNGDLVGLPLPQQAPPRATADPFDQIRKLAELRDAGLLTTEEFESKKADLLSRV